MLGPFQEHIEADHPIVNGTRSLLPLLIPFHVGEAVCAAHLLKINLSGDSSEEFQFPPPATNTALVRLSASLCKKGFHRRSQRYTRTRRGLPYGDALPCEDGLLPHLGFER